MNTDSPKPSVLVGALILFVFMLLGSFVAKAQRITVLDPCDASTKRIIFDQYTHARAVFSDEAAILWVELQKSRREYDACKQPFDSGTLSEAQAAYDARFNPDCPQCDIQALLSAKTRLEAANRKLKKEYRIRFKLAKHLYTRCLKQHRPRLTIEFR